MNSNDYGFNTNLSYSQYSNYWNKYDSVIKELSNDQKLYVSKQKNVLQAKQNLMSAFIDYLFEQQKNYFILANDNIRQLADEYINSITSAAKSYMSHQEELEKQNARLEKEKTELEKQIQQLMLNFEAQNGNKKSTK